MMTKRDTITHKTYGASTRKSKVVSIKRIARFLREKRTELPEEWEVPKPAFIRKIGS